MLRCMKKQSSHVKCKECRKEILEVELRDHWYDYHGEKLQAIDKWLGKRDDAVRQWERVAKEGMIGFRERKENEN